MTPVYILAGAIAYAAFLLFVWCLCRLAARNHDPNHMLDEPEHPLGADRGGGFIHLGSDV